MLLDDMPGPSVGELAAIEAEWPLIAAELDVLDAQILMVYAADRGGPTALDWRRLRRAQQRVTATAARRRPSGAHRVRVPTSPVARAAGAFSKEVAA